MASCSFYKARTQNQDDVLSKITNIVTESCVTNSDCINLWECPRRLLVLQCHDATEQTLSQVPLGPFKAIRTHLTNSTSFHAFAFCIQSNNPPQVKRTFLFCENNPLSWPTASTGLRYGLWSFSCFATAYTSERHAFGIRTFTCVAWSICMSMGCTHIDAAY